MWESTSLYPSEKDDVRFHDIYHTKLTYFLSLQKDADPTPVEPIMFRPPYNWSNIEHEIRHLTNESTRPIHHSDWVPMVPAQLVNDTRAGKLRRAQQLLYAMDHLTEDAVYRHEPKKVALPPHHSYRYRMPWIIYLTDIILLILIGYSVYVRTENEFIMAVVVLVLLLLTYGLNRF